MKHVLITGVLGLVGTEAAKFFKDKGWVVHGMDSQMRSEFFGGEYNDEWHDFDIRSELEVNSFFSQYGDKLNAIIHTAAQPSHDYSADHVLEDFDINARGTVILLEALRKYAPNAVFVHVSTDKVYGENMLPYSLIRGLTRYHSPDEFDEKLGLDFARKRSPFGCSKAAADIYAQEYANYFDLNVGVFRPGCITGRNHKGAEQHGFLAYLAKCIKTGTPYKIYGFDGKQVRDQIHAYDLVNAFWHFIQNPNKGGVYNIGGGIERSVSVLEAIDLIEKETGKKAITEYADKPRLGDRIWDVHDISKFKLRYPAWEYKYSLTDIIKDLCQN